jgi:hypothetical protein
MFALILAVALLMMVVLATCAPPAMAGQKQGSIALVMVLEVPGGSAERLTFSGFTSLRICETAGRAKAKLARSIEPYWPVAWDCVWQTQPVQWIQPQIDQIYLSGQMPDQLLLGVQE